MTTANFHQQFDEYIPEIQSLASRLTNDFELARFLYLETAHQAFKHKKSLKKKNLRSWLMHTVKRIHAKVTRKHKSANQLYIAA